MNKRSFIDEVHGYIRLALPLMSKQGIPITPKNYSVWYMYVSGANGELALTIDEMLRDGVAFTEEKNEDLYRRFCVEKSDTELRKVREDLQQVLRTILKEVTDLTGQTEEYESFVSHSVNTLSEDASVQDIKKVIGEIIDKTRTLGKFGKSIQHKLKETTEALEELKRDFEQVKTEVFVDFLTGIANRKSFDNTLAACIDEAAAEGKELSLLLVDIDDFKRFNDEFGHLTGDEVLKFVAKKIREIVKGRDFVGRFGGEEFGIILPRTGLAGAATLAENIRSLFAETSLRTVTAAKYLGVVAVSIGVASHRPEESSEDFIHRCDQALYAAKKAGKNRVVTVSNHKH